VLARIVTVSFQVLSLSLLVSISPTSSQHIVAIVARLACSIASLSILLALPAALNTMSDTENRMKVMMQEFMGEMRGRFEDFTYEMRGRFDGLDGRFDRLLAATLAPKDDAVAKSVTGTIKESSEGSAQGHGIFYKMQVDGEEERYFIVSAAHVVVHFDPINSSD
jgi:hypothetical protein